MLSLFKEVKNVKNTQSKHIERQKMTEKHLLKAKWEDLVQDNRHNIILESHTLSWNLNLKMFYRKKSNN